MEPDFWHRRWRKNEIGFHNHQVNPHLARWWPETLGQVQRVFVPLCGKTLDIAWLLNRGHEVVACELSELAVQQLFSEAGWQASVSSESGFLCYRGEGLTVWVGDFFQLDTTRLGHVDAVYDRAALIALPSSMRERYAGHLRGLCPKLDLLCITVEYEQSRMDGPPFAVLEAEIRALYHGLAITCLERLDTLSDNPRFIERGLETMAEAVYRIRPL